MNTLSGIKSRIPLGLYRLLKAKILKGKFPHAIQFNITFKCNQRCMYCGIYNDTRQEMTTEQICRMIDEFVELGTARISFTGGEPLLRKDFSLIAGYARKQGLSVSLATNGSLVGKCTDALDNINSVNMTLDGTEVIHDQQRGKGNFKIVMNALELIRSKGIPVYFVSVITKNNCMRINELLELGRSLDVKLIVQPVFYSEQSHASNLEGYMDAKYDDKIMMETLDQLIKLKEQGDSTLILSKRYYKNVKESIRKGRKMICSHGGSLFCTISPDGRVAPCNLLVRDSRWLNGNEIGFRKAFINMPEIKCEGCLSSFMDIDDMYSFKIDVAWNYYKQYLKLYT